MAALSMLPYGRYVNPCAAMRACHDYSDELSAFVDQW